MRSNRPSTPAPVDEHQVRSDPVGGPVSAAWREATLTRAKELESLCACESGKRSGAEARIMQDAIGCHLDAARDAANRAEVAGKRHPLFRHGPLVERAMTNLHAAEADLLRFASPEFVLGEMPSLLRHVQCHLPPTDPRRQEFERIAKKVGVKDPDHPRLPAPTGNEHAADINTVEQERGKIVAIVRAASSAGLREQVRLRSFRNVIVVTTAVMVLLTIAVALVGLFDKTLIPLCFAPEEAGQQMVVCPTAQSDQFPSTGQPSGTPAATPTASSQPTATATATAQPSPFAAVPATPSPSVSGSPQATVQPDIDEKIEETASRADLFVVELVGLMAAAVAAATAIRGIRGSSERLGLPVALAVLKLPTGAITAFLGLLLMRGQFVPGLSALDTSAQILAWALVFGYAQQLFTRLVDRQGQTVLDSVRGADNPPTSTSQP